MARYWRIIAIATNNGTLELSEAVLYEGGVLVAVTPTSTIAPTSGTMADLADGLTSAVVTWSGNNTILMWDTAGLTNPRVRLGSGTNEDAFPVDFVVQSSDDAFSWASYVAIGPVAYPGASTLTPTPPADDPVDSYAGSVKLFLNDAITDSSPLANVISSIGIVTMDGGYSRRAFHLDGTTKVTVPASSGMGVITGDFTIEAWVRPDHLANNTMDIVDARTTAATAAPWTFGITCSAGAGIPYFYNAGTYFNSSITILPQTWVHLAVTRAGTVLKVYVNNVLGHTGTLSGTLSGTTTTPIYIGGKNPVQYSFIGDIASVRFTTVARTPAEFLPEHYMLQMGTRKYKTRSMIVGVHTIAGDLPTIISVNRTDQPFTHSNPYHGGQSRIVGTVKEKGLPTNLPLVRRVILIDERSQQVISETWSNAAGDYVFNGVRGDIRYTVVSYDHTGIYRAVVADNLIAEVMT